MTLTQLAQKHNLEPESAKATVSEVADRIRLDLQKTGVAKPSDIAIVLGDPAKSFEYVAKCWNCNALGCAICGHTITPRLIPLIARPELD